LDKAQKAMQAANVPCEDALKAILASAQMSASGLFSERKITTWEEKVHTDKTWADLKTYFAKLYKSKMQYTKGEARRNGYESVNAMRAEEHELEQNMAALMEAFQTKTTEETGELNAIKEEQKEFTKFGETMMEQMKQQQKLIEKLSKKMDSASRLPPVVPPIVPTEQPAGRPRQQQQTPAEREAAKHLCPNCNWRVFHQPNNCPEINEAKRWAGWTSRL
jgi:hypothetical protein